MSELKHLVFKVIFISKIANDYKVIFISKIANDYKVSFISKIANDYKVSFISKIVNSLENLQFEIGFDVLFCANINL